MPFKLADEIAAADAHMRLKPRQNRKPAEGDLTLHLTAFR
jgi:hypothetical protein